MSDEHVASYSVRLVLSRRRRVPIPDVLPNLRWLIPACLDDDVEQLHAVDSTSYSYESVWSVLDAKTGQEVTRITGLHPRCTNRTFDGRPLTDFVFREVR